MMIITEKFTTVNCSIYRVQYHRQKV